MKKNNTTSLVGGIIFFIIGIILFINPDKFIEVISYVIGGILILIGLYKVINYYIKDRDLKVVNRNEIAFGITAIILGIVFIFLADAIKLVLRFIIGGYLILIGISKIFQTFYTTDRSSKFYALIIVGLLIIIGGIYTIVKSNLPLKIIGLIMVIYGVIDIISFFLYKNMDTKTLNLNSYPNEEETKEQTDTKEESKAEKEVIEEVEFTPKKEKTTKKKGNKK